MAIDATTKLDSEHPRPWPHPLRARPEIEQLLDQRWAEYSLGVEPAERLAESKPQDTRDRP